jgi:ABC-2 type transport system ATP-binding protein
MIQVDISMRYGEKVAVEELAFSDKPGLVTGLLGPDEAGEATTMHPILGLES